MTLGEIIKEKRKQLGFTQLDLAEKLNISILKVATWEASEELPSDEQFILLSKILECPISDLTDKIIEEKVSINETVEEPKIEDLNVSLDKEVINDTIQEEKVEPKRRIIVDDKKKYTYCKKCGSKFLSDEIHFVNFKCNFEYKKVYVCDECERNLRKEISKRVHEEILNENYLRRKRALIFQLSILAFTAIIAVLLIVLQAGYVAPIIIGSIGLLLSMTVASIFFSNVSLIVKWKEVGMQFVNREELTHYEYERTEGLLVSLTPLIFILSFIIYPISLYRSFAYADSSMSKARYEIEIRDKIYSSIYYNSKYNG